MGLFIHGRCQRNILQYLLSKELATLDEQDWIVLIRFGGWLRIKCAYCKISTHKCFVDTGSRSKQSSKPQPKSHNTPRLIAYLLQIEAENARNSQIFTPKCWEMSSSKQQPLPHSLRPVSQARYRGCLNPGTSVNLRAFILFIFWNMKM
jgi:hypothetical protein